MFDDFQTTKNCPHPPALLLGWLGLVTMLLFVGACKQDVPGDPAQVPQPAEPAAHGEESPNSLTDPNSPSPALPQSTDDDSAVAPGKSQLLHEYWEKHVLRGSHIGHAHFVVERVPAEDDNPEVRTLICTTSQAESVVERVGQPITQKMTLRSWDTPEGKLVRFEAEMDDGSEKKISRGRVDQSREQLVIESDSNGKTDRFTLPWKNEYGGFFAVEQSLRNKPLQPGEERAIFALLPMLNLVAENRLHAKSAEAVSLPGGAEQLLKVEGVTLISIPQANPQRFDTSLWVNDRGEVLKSEMTGLQQVTLRATREQALQKEAGKPAMDLIEESVVKVTPPLENPLQTKRVLYRAKMTEGSLAGIFAEGLSQRVKLIDDQTAEIEVLAVNLNTELPDTLTITPPVPADSASNGLIQSDDPRIGRLAMVPRPPTDPFGIARDLEALVNRSIRKKNFSKAFASAAEVVRTMEGDCTEHAVLLAATCRARKVPTRVAIGLVYYPPQQGFAYHMWNEVWTGDRWVPLDATLGQGQVAADRLKLADSNLEGANAYSALLPVVQVFGRLELEVLEVE